MKYPTLKELFEELNIAMKNLKGKCPKKENNSISELVEDAIQKIIVSEKYSYYLLKLESCELSLYVSTFKRYLTIGEFKPTYRIDKRRRDDRSDYLEKVDFVLKKSVQESIDLELINLSQKLTYDFAKKNHDRLVREVKELEKEIAERMEGIKKYEDIMRIEKYK